jgi:glycosyltransferase involved in cell wall biosynthesis
MAKFIMLDHSLYGVGGHHYAYAANVLRAAEAMGHEIVLIAHAGFRPPADLPTSWRLIPAFTRDAYHGFSVFDGNEQSLRSMISLYPQAKSLGGRTWDWLQANINWRNVSRTHRRRVRQRRKNLRQTSHVLDQFVRECDEAFKLFDVCAGDTVFVPTLTEFDLKWIVMFLARRPNLSGTPWHLQFHFNFLEGREPEYSTQCEQLEAMRKHFAAQIAHVPDHRLLFYTTTRPLAAQYERLGVGPFQPLPYPVTSESSVRNAEPARVKAHRRFRLTCGGCVRPEKGYEWLNSAVADLWDDYFAPGRLQLVIQTDVKNLPLSLPRRQRPQFVDDIARVESADAPVVCVRGPLPADDYARLIQAADIGLFLYDSRRYYTRCSGVLLEMLSAGVPVIVPAGCWLSAQIAEEVSSHLDALLPSLSTVKHLSAAEAGWRPMSIASVRASGDQPPGIPTATKIRDAVVFGGTDDVASCTLRLPVSATDLGLRLTWPDSSPPGVYVRLVSRQFDASGRSVATYSTILEQRADHQATPALVHLRGNAARVELILENAFNDSTVVADVDLTFVAADGHCAAGASGLIAADRGQLPELLADLTQNYAHYRQTATAFAKQLTWNHLPERTVAALKSNQGRVDQLVADVQRRARAA